MNQKPRVLRFLGPAASARKMFRGGQEYEIEDPAEAAALIASGTAIEVQPSAPVNAAASVEEPSARRKRQ